MKLKKVEEKKIRQLEHLFLTQDKDESGYLDRAEFENLMLTDAMQQKISILGISVEEVDDMFKVCDYTHTGVVIVHDLAEGLVQGLRPVTGKDILKLGQNGKRVTNSLEKNDQQVSKHQQRLIKICDTVRLLLDEVRVAEEILIHPDRQKALDVVRKKLYERSHMLHPSVISLNEKDYQVGEIEGEEPAICLTSRGTGRLVILPSKIKGMLRTQDMMVQQANAGEE